MDQRWADGICAWEARVAAIELGHGELGLQAVACQYRDELELLLVGAEGPDAAGFAVAIARLDERYRQATRPLAGDRSDTGWWWGRVPLQQDSRPEQARRNLPWVIAYGEDYADSDWGGVYLNWEGPVASVACFTGDIARHEAALRRFLPHPELLVVRRVSRNEADLATALAQAEVMLSETPGPWTADVRWLETEFVVRVRLLRENTDTAARLRERFGGLVRVELCL